MTAEPGDEPAPVNGDEEKAALQRMNGPSADGSAAVKADAAAKADGKENGKAAEAEATAEVEAAAPAESDAQAKPRLLDRLASISKQ